MDSGHSKESKVSGSGVGGKETDLTLSRLIRDFVIILLLLIPTSIGFGMWYGYKFGKEKGKEFVQNEAVRNGFGDYFVVDSLTDRKDFKWRR